MPLHHGSRDTGRDAEWELIGKASLNGLVDRERTDADEIVTRVELPPRGADQKADKQIFTMHVRIKNEW